MKIIICTVMCILIAKEIECGNKIYVTPSILPSRVSDGDLTSSCVVVEDGVPVCQDPGETNANYMRSSAVRTPYPADGFDAVENSDWKTHGGGGGGGGGPRARGSSWSWWFGGPKQKRPQKEPRATAIAAASSVHVIVTYLLKGCSPTKAPFGLFPCSARHDGGQQDTAMRISSSTRTVYYVPPPSSSTQQQPSSSRPKATLLRPNPRETGRTSA